MQVLGTNGKGSTAAMTAWALQRAGLRVGLFTSPHLHRVAERVRVDFEPVDEAKLQAAVDRVLAQEPVAGRQLSFFEVLTLAAWCCFGDAGVDVIVNEAGLGGRLDSTSARPAQLCLLTQVALDHQVFLGDQVEDIAREKLGALCPGQLVLHSPQVPAVQAVIEARRAEGLELAEVGPLAAGSEIRVPLPGDHQRANASLALSAHRLLLGAPAPADVFDGFSWPGRGERLDFAGGELVFDVGHNPAGIAALVAWLEAGTQTQRPDVVLFGCAVDKGPDVRAAMRASLERLETTLIEVRPQGPRGSRGQGRAIDTKLLAEVESHLTGGARVLVCGSHFVVAPVRAWALGLDPDNPLHMDPPELTDPVGPSRA